MKSIAQRREFVNDLAKSDRILHGMAGIYKKGAVSFRIKETAP
jgi:hypothetical protein